MRLLSLFLVLLGWTTATNPREFVGEWRAEHKGKAFIVLNIEEKNGLAGTLRLGGVELDDEGTVIEATEASASKHPLTGVREADGPLQFKSEDDDGDTTACELRLTGQGTACLRIEGAPASMKALPLKRQ